MAKETSLKNGKLAESAENSAEAKKERASGEVDATQEQTPKKVQKAGKEPVYSPGEFAKNAQNLFGTRQECVAAALKTAGKSEYTVSEAKEIVQKFLKREVK